MHRLSGRVQAFLPFYLFSVHEELVLLLFFPLLVKFVWNKIKGDWHSKKIGEDKSFGWTPGLNNIKDDLEKTFQAILQGVLGKLDLVTREEFEVQKLVLAKTRSKLEDLEKRVAEIESKVVSDTEA